MNSGLQTTFEHLANTRNEAVVSVLIAVLGNARREVRDGALRTLAQRRSEAGHREILQRWHTFDDTSKSIVAEYPTRMAGAVRDAIVGNDAQLAANGCDAVLWVREYDLMPALINAAEDKSAGRTDLAARTLLELAQRLYDELAQPRDYSIRRDPQVVRTRVVSSLESSLTRFSEHRRVEIIEAFLLLANRENPTLKRVLHETHDPAHEPVVEALLRSERPGLIRLLLDYLEHPRAPLATIHLLARRNDAKYLGFLFERIGNEPSAAAKANLKRMDAVEWVRGDLRVLDALDDDKQRAAVQMAIASGVKRLQAFPVIEYLLVNGKSGGRQAASAALAEFRWSRANELVLQALDDDDPKVQANALVQLRERGIPGALARLMDLIDSPHDVVSNAARGCLSEFSFERFLATFDVLAEDVRRSTGLLVRKIDQAVPAKLAKELQAKSRSRRSRAVSVAEAVDAVSELQEQIIGLLQDEDHLIRAEAAMVLARSDAPRARQALREALIDRSRTVREAAERGLQMLASRSDRAGEASTTDGGRASGSPAPIDVQTHAETPPQEAI